MKNRMGLKHCCAMQMSQVQCSAPFHAPLATGGTHESQQQGLSLQAGLGRLLRPLGAEYILEHSQRLLGCGRSGSLSQAQPGRLPVLLQPDSLEGRPWARSQPDSRRQSKPQVHRRRSSTLAMAALDPPPTCERAERPREPAEIVVGEPPQLDNSSSALRGLGQDTPLSPTAVLERGLLKAGAVRGTDALGAAGVMDVCSLTQCPASEEAGDGAWAAAHS